MSTWRETVAADPYAAHLGLRLTGVPGEVRLTVRPDLVNGVGLLLGPVAFALLDYAMTDAVFAVIGADERPATVNIATNFLASTDTGEVVARARVDRRGRRLVSLGAELATADGRLLATAVGTFAVSPRPTSGS